MRPIDVRHPALPGVFDPAMPNGPMVHGVLSGGLPGRAIADDPVTTTLALVQDRQGITFISADATTTALEDGLTTLRAAGMVGLAWRWSEHAGIASRRHRPRRSSGWVAGP